MAIQKMYVEPESKDPWQSSVIDKDLTIAPESPSESDRYIIAGIEGNWSAGTIKDIAQYSSSTWIFITPLEGMKAYVDDEDKYYKYNGSAWVEDTGGTGATELNGLIDVDFDSGTPTDNQVLTYDNVSGKWKAEDSAGGAGISNVVEDTTPQLGGDLDMNGYSIGGNTETQIDDAVAKKHTSNTDTALGAQSENLDMNTHKVVGVVDPTADQDATTKKYVDAIDDKTIKNQDNIMINAFRIAVNGSLSQFNMIDGIVDEYEDETGIDTVNSLNEVYDSTDDYYRPTVNDYDSSVKLMLHLDGTDGATTTTDESQSAHAITFVGTAQLDTAYKKWGTASLLLDGNSDYLTIPDSADFDIVANNSDDWTLDCWVRLANYASASCHLFSKGYTDGTLKVIRCHYHYTGGFYINVEDAGTPVIATGIGGVISDTNFHHFALCKVADEYAIYVDGVQVNYVQDSSVLDIGGLFYIGCKGTDGSPEVATIWDGHIDEFKIQKSNSFSASPNVGKTDTITVPTAEYAKTTADMTLISDTFVAEAAPDDGRIVILEEDVDAITLGTDIKAFMAIDGGSNWHEGTLSDEGDYDATKRILVADFDVSAQATTNVEYKLETHNSKNCRIHAVGLSWA